MGDSSSSQGHPNTESVPRVSFGQSTLTPGTVETLLASEDEDEDSAVACVHNQDLLNQIPTPNSGNEGSLHLCEPYFNSIMGGKDVRVLFAMSVGLDEPMPKHTEPPFYHSKTYHKEVKPDLGTLQQEVTRRFKAYKFQGRQPRPANWNKEKCMEYLASNPIPLDNVSEIRYLNDELLKWKDIQEMINQSHIDAEESVVGKTWSNDVPFLRLYHCLIDDSLRSKFAKSFTVKTRQELDGRNNQGLYRNFYDELAEKFNDKTWVPVSLALPNLHEAFTESKPLPLTVSDATGEQLKKKLTDARYKMVKVIADWERSGSGRGMVMSQEDEYDMDPECLVYAFVDGDDRKNFLREKPYHILYLWHVSYEYGILSTVRQQLSQDASLDGSNAPSVSSRKRKSSPGDMDSASERAVFSESVQQMSQSIDGLVSAATRSTETHSLDIKCRRRKELEDSIESLEKDIFEIEVKLIGAEPQLATLYRRMYDKKSEDIKQKKKELDTVVQEIVKQNELLSQSSSSGGRRLFPSFINVQEQGIIASTHAP